MQHPNPSLGHMHEDEEENEPNLSYFLPNGITEDSPPKPSTRLSEPSFGPIGGRASWNQPSNGTTQSMHLLDEGFSSFRLHPESHPNQFFLPSPTSTSYGYQGQRPPTSRFFPDRRQVDPPLHDTYQSPAFASSSSYRSTVASEAIPTYLPSSRSSMASFSPNANWNAQALSTGEKKKVLQAPPGLGDDADEPPFTDQKLPSFTSSGFDTLNNAQSPPLAETSAKNDFNGFNSPLSSLTLPFDTTPSLASSPESKLAELNSSSVPIDSPVEIPTSKESPPQTPTPKESTPQIPTAITPSPQTPIANNSSPEIPGEEECPSSYSTPKKPTPVTSEPVKSTPSPGSCDEKSSPDSSWVTVKHQTRDRPRRRKLHEVADRTSSEEKTPVISEPTPVDKSYPDPPPKKSSSNSDKSESSDDVIQTQVKPEVKSKPSERKIKQKKKERKKGRKKKMVDEESVLEEFAMETAAESTPLSEKSKAAALSCLDGLYALLFSLYTTFKGARVACQRAWTWLSRRMQLTSYCLTVFSHVESVMAVVFSVVLLVSLHGASWFIRVHRVAFRAVLTHRHIGFCFAFMYAFPLLVQYVFPWAPPWAPVCLWYAFLVQLFCTGGSSAMTTTFRVLLPLVFVVEGISYHSFLLDLNGAELLLAAFILSALKTSTLSSPIFFLSLAAQCLSVVFLGSDLLVQWFQSTLALYSLHCMASEEEWGGVEDEDGVLPSMGLPSVAEYSHQTMPTASAVQKNKKVDKRALAYVRGRKLH